MLDCLFNLLLKRDLGCNSRHHKGAGEIGWTDDRMLDPATPSDSEKIRRSTDVRNSSNHCELNIDDQNYRNSRNYEYPSTANSDSAVCRGTDMLTHIIRYVQELRVRVPF